MSALVTEIPKSEKCVKYANKIPDDVIHSTQFYNSDINRAILVNLVGSQFAENTPTAIKILFSWQLTLFHSPPT